VNEGAIRAIVADAGIEPGDRVVEVGAGLGSLTVALAEVAAEVVAVEADRSLVPALRETMEMLLRDRPVRFEVAVAPDAVVATDPERLRQVLVNLLANAAKFTHEGCVRLVAARVDQHVCLSVEDTGPGMDPALGPDALEPFVRGAHESTGSGLGLAIVARLLPLLGGRLSIDSEPGWGTQVRVRLPAA